MEEIWKAIGRTTAVPLPFSQAAPQEVTDTEQFDEMGKQAERMRLRRIRSCEMRTKRQTAEEEKLRRKQQEDWVSELINSQFSGEFYIFCGPVC